MDLLILNKIKQNPKYYEYLKENSEWIKKFTRYTATYKDYEYFLKEKYKLRVTDKISSTIDNIDLVANIISNLK